MKKLEKKYPLLKEGYDVLECPNCETECYPDAKRANGTIIYNLHKCKSDFELVVTKRSFEINKDGEIVEGNGF